PQDGPVVVRAGFELRDVNEIDDEAEVFEFTGVMTLQWKDPRQAFDPAVEGVGEKVFQGGYQVNEISTGWYPQVVLVNEAGMYEKSGVVLRVRPDGTSTLVETLTASAESEMDMRRFPFDRHRLEAIFVVLGFGRDEVRLEVAPGHPVHREDQVSIPQWGIRGSGLSVRDQPAPGAAPGDVSSAFVLGADVQRHAFYSIRLVAFPLFVIVLLSFSVFWMDKASLGDRLSVSFVGILTGVAFQITISEHLPAIAYVTLIHGFLSLSFVTMCATVVVNLRVSVLDKRGESARGDRIDGRCRWAFPLAYFTLIVAVFLIAFLFY
ncbi:MAG: hypothetical protein ABR538_13915, partial [Candidatus Binatia bacterium]